MKTTSVLPENYKEILSVDLQKSKKLALLVNGIALIIAALLTGVGMLITPISALFDMEDGLLPYILRFATLIVGCVLYIILHEAVHGVAMKLCGSKKIKYGFTGMYAFAGSDDYYGKKNYIFIALAPVVMWGIVLAVINVFLSDGWFWVVYFIQIVNLSGAAGDLYVTVRFLFLPKDILVKDVGTSMKVYSEE